MTGQEKTKEQLVTELAELRQRIALKAAETESKRAEQAILNRRTWLPVASMFVLLGVLVWLDEILSLPRLLGAPHTPINWREAIIETVMIAGLGLFADNIHAQFDAFITDEYRRPCNQLAHLMLALTAKATVKCVLAVTA